MSLKRNVLANFLGQGWSALMGLAFVPVYIRFLGIEAYGLIGLFAALQAWLVLLDLGMTPALGREMARFTAGEHDAQSIRNLLRSFELIAVGLAIAAGLTVSITSSWLASDWLQAQQLPRATVSEAIAVMAWVLALRFVESIYRSALFGLQRQVSYNVVNAVMSTLRGAGAALVLAAVSASIEAFFLWQAAVSMLSVLILGAAVHRILPPGQTPGRFSLDSLRSVWRFAGGMTGITLLALLLTQTDKLLLSRLLSLEAFGHYMLAATVAGALYLVVTPVTTALFPRLVQLVSQEDARAQADVYHRSAQLVTVLTAPPALVLVFFGQGALLAWSGDNHLATTSGPVLSALAFGTFLNCLMYVPYQLQLAHGWTRLAIWINLVAVALLVPALLWVVPRHGALGAAWIWITLNSGYVIVGIHLMHRRLVPSEKRLWYLADVGAPTLGAAAALLLWSGLKPADLDSQIGWLMFIVGGLASALIASIASAPYLRGRVSASVRGFASS